MTTWEWVFTGLALWVIAVCVIIALTYAGHGPGRGEARNYKYTPDRPAGECGLPARRRPSPVPARPSAPVRPPLPGPTPAQVASDASPPPGPGTTARVLRFRADLECGCRITHYLGAGHSMRTDPCPEHGWCGLCGWQIGALNGGRYAYVWEMCPAHDTNQARHP